MRDPTWFDTALAVFLILWGLFIVFGGLATLGWWLGGLFSTEPGTYTSGRAAGAVEPASVPFDRSATRGNNHYIIYDDPDSTAQALEDDREWHHERRRAEGNDACPECGAVLRDPG